MVGCIPEVVTLIDIHKYGVCQYGCQKKREDLRNAANHRRYPTIMRLRNKNWNIMLPDFSFVFFGIFFVYFFILEGPLTSYLVVALYTIGHHIWYLMIQNYNMRGDFHTLRYIFLLAQYFMSSRYCNVLFTVIIVQSMDKWLELFYY